MPRVTVVVPTLDRKEFLEQALKTVRLQTHEPLECIVVDDGSTDGTREYLDSLDYDALRTVYRDEAKGPSSARNAGIDASEGKYVIFLDSDDILYPHAVETLVEALEEQPDDCAGAFASKKMVTPHGRERNRRVPPGTMTEAILENAKAIGGPSSTTFRRDALEDVGGFDESFDALEDLHLYVTLLKQYSLFGVDEICCERRIHDNQLSKDMESVTQGFRRFGEKHSPEDSERGGEQ